jgi:hypothetical protein
MAFIHFVGIVSTLQLLAVPLIHINTAAQFFRFIAGPGWLGPPTTPSDTSCIIPQLLLLSPTRIQKHLAESIAAPHAHFTAAISCQALFGG